MQCITRANGEQASPGREGWRHAPSDLTPVSLPVGMTAIVATGCFDEAEPFRELR